MAEAFAEHPAEMGVVLEASLLGNLLQRKIAVQHLLLCKLQPNINTVGEQGLAKSGFEQIRAA
ncbi:hypothetical protein D3C85_1789170 [compost metagenome]